MKIVVMIYSISVIAVAKGIYSDEMTSILTANLN